MCSESVRFKRCLFCIPLRYGLLVFGYLKLLGFLLLISYFLLILTFLVSYDDLESPTFVTLNFVTVLLLIDVGFSVCLIIAAHKKLAKLLRIYYYYAIVAVVISVIILCSGLGYEFVSLFKEERDSDFKTYFLHEILYLACAVIIVVLQIYVILLIRTELNKLEDNYNCRFVNNTADAECILQQQEQENNRKKNYS